VLKGKTIRGAASLFFNFSLLPYIRDTLANMVVKEKLADLSSSVENSFLDN